MTEAGAVAARLLDAPPPSWESLLGADRNATPAHRPGLWQALSATMPGMTARFLAVEERGRLLGGVAILVERRAGFHWIHALPHVLSGAPLACEGAHRTVDLAVGEGLARLQRELGAVGGEWALYRPEGPEVEPAAIERVSGETRFVEASLIDLDDGVEARWRRLDRDTRHELRRARASGLKFAEEPQALEEAYALHLAQSRIWPGYRPLPLELGRRLLERNSAGNAPPLARLFTVRDARGIVGATLVLDHAREAFAWWSGARASGRARHAAAFLFWSASEWACAAGRARLNLGGSQDVSRLLAFKQSLGARGHRYPLRWLDARRAPWAARRVAALQRRARGGRFRGEPE